MTLMCVKTRDLSWQDRTLNIELMMAPTRSQLLYNKHKGLASKCQQEKSYLEREKVSFLRSFKTDKRMMERRKERYSKSRSAILQRRSSLDRSRTPNSNLGRNSAPPILDAEPRTFLTQAVERESKSAGPGAIRSPRPQVISRSPSKLAHLTSVDSYIGEKDKGSSGAVRRHPPFLERLGRQKSVRFERGGGVDKTDTTDDTVNKTPEPPIEERIKQFLDSQSDFNARFPDPRKIRGTPSPSSTSSNLAKRYSGLTLKVSQLELAFDKFCGNSSDEGFQKLVRYASKMKANVKMARNSSLVPTMASLRTSKVFKDGTLVPNAWIPSRR